MNVKDFLTSYKGKERKVIIVGSFYEMIIIRPCKIDEIIIRGSRYYSDNILYSEIIKWKISKDDKILIQIGGSKFEFDNFTFDLERYYDVKPGESKRERELRIAVSRITGNLPEEVKQKLEREERIYKWEDDE